MSDNNNNGHQEEQSNNIRTDSNLPILFANGYPTSLEKMSGDQLEMFIPFLIKCSRDGSDEDETTVPKWWPSGVEFKFPLEKPKNCKKNWEAKLRKIVEDCYNYHSQPFLLKYSHQLSQNETANLRYVTASESTTSLYSRHPKKLLLTFRNENMLYDNKKKRMKLWKKDDTPSESPEHSEKEDDSTSTFHIMLCDYCDGEFYSDEAFTNHERECGKKQSEIEAPIIDNIVISDDDEEELEETDNVINGQHDFMAYFYLASSTASELPRRSHFIERSLSPKKKRPTHRTRNVVSKKEKDLEKAIPFSSPAGLVLTKKAIVSEEYITESQEEIDAYTQANKSTKIPSRPRLRQLGPDTNVLKEMRKSRKHYYWPRRHLNSMCRDVNFEFLNRSLIEDLPEMTVVLNKMSENDVRAIKDNFRLLRERKKLEESANCVDLCSDSDSSCFSDDVENFDETMKINGDFLAMSMTESSILRCPKFHTSPLINPFSSELPLTEEVFISHRSQRITSSSSSNLSQQLFTTSFTRSKQEFSSSTPISIKSSFKRTNDNEGEGDTHRAKIQKWIQNVNGENFNTSNQVSVVNTN